jgi:hypothetical protein
MAGAPGSPGRPQAARGRREARGPAPGLKWNAREACVFGGRAARGYCKARRVMSRTPRPAYPTAEDAERRRVWGTEGHGAN